MSQNESCDLFGETSEIIETISEVKPYKYTSISAIIQLLVEKYTEKKELKELGAVGFICTGTTNLNDLYSTRSRLIKEIKIKGGKVTINPIDLYPLCVEKVYLSLKEKPNDNENFNYSSVDEFVKITGRNGFIGKDDKKIWYNKYIVTKITPKIETFPVVEKIETVPVVEKVETVPVVKPVTEIVGPVPEEKPKKWKRKITD